MQYYQGVWEEQLHIPILGGKNTEQSNKNKTVQLVNIATPVIQVYSDTETF